MIFIPFESANRDESNNINFIKIQSLDHVPFPNILKCLCSYISVNIGARKMNVIPFESANRDESNGKIFIEIQSLDHELFAILYLHELHYKSRDWNCGIADYYTQFYSKIRNIVDLKK